MVSYDYSTDAKKLLTKTNYANGQAIEYSYSGEKVIGIKFSGDSGYRFEYAYDEDGEMTQKIDHVSGMKYVFTAEDVKVYDMSNGETLVRSYTVNSDLFTETVNNVTYSSDFLENRDKFILSETQSINRAYTNDSSGRLATARIYQLSGEEETTAFTTSFTYNGDDNITAISHLLNGTAFNLAYTYDEDGKVTGVTQNNVGTSYVYDANGELVRVNDGQQNKTVAYSYDARGNLLSRSEYAYTTGELSAVQPVATIPYVYGDTNWPDLLTAYNGKAITYDATGNRLTYDGWAYEWEGGRQLKQMSKGEDTYSYKYDDNGIRQSKTVNGVTTAYTTIDGKITSQTDGTNTLYLRYSSDETPLGFQLNGTEYLYILNLQGDIIAVADLNGTVVAEYAYDAWGRVLSVTGTLADTVGRLNPMRYRGYYYDSETGYYYLQSRYYDPEIGRFINADASHILQLTKDQSSGMNLFAYCFNDPINSVDPTGYIAATVATLIFAILGAYTAISFIVASPSFQNSWNNFCRTIGNGLSWVGSQLSKVASSVRKWSVSQLKAVRSSLDTLTRCQRRFKNARKRRGNFVG